MRTFVRVPIFLGAFLLVVGAMAGDLETSGDDSGDSVNVGLVKSGYAAFAAGDMDGVVGLMSPDLVWYEAETLPYGGVYHGPDAVMENIFTALGRDWSDYAAEPLRFIDGGDHVVGLGEYRGMACCRRRVNDRNPDLFGPPLLKQAHQGNAGENGQAG